MNAIRAIRLSIFVVFFSVLLLSCSKSSNSEVEFRLILRNGLVLPNVAVEVYPKSNCAIISNTVTDEDGVFSLDLDPTQSYSVLVRINNIESGGIIESSLINELVINDVLISDFSGGTISFNNDQDFQTIEIGETAIVELQVDIPNYPLNKTIIQFFEQFENLSFQTTPDASGKAVLEISGLAGPKEYDFEVIVKNLEGDIITNGKYVIRVIKSVDLNFRYEIDECMGIRLHWDSYPDADFETYEIIYSSSVDDGFCSIDFVNSVYLEGDQSTTTALIVDFPLIDTICFNLRLFINSLPGALTEETIRVKNPFDKVLPGTGFVSANFLSSSEILTITADDPHVCQTDLNDNSSTCTQIDLNSAVIDFGEYNNEPTFMINEGQFIDLRDINFNLIKRVLVGDIGHQFQLMDNGILASSGFTSGVNIYLTDLDAQRIEDGIKYGPDVYQFLQFIETEKEDELLVVLQDLVKTRDVLFVYKINSVDNIDLLGTYELSTSNFTRKYFSNPSASLIISETGELYSIGENPVSIGSLFPSTARFNRMYLNDQIVVAIEDNIRKILVFDVTTMSLVNEIDICLWLNFVGLNEDNQLIALREETSQALSAIFPIDVLQTF